jgi:hypothetical protein
MVPNQLAEWLDLIATEVTNQPAHIESEKCWCDPVLAIDENRRKVLIHQEVTWH